MMSPTVVLFHFPPSDTPERTPKYQKSTKTYQLIVKKPRIWKPSDEFSSV